MAHSFKTHAGRARSAQMTAGEMEGSGSADLSLAPAPRSIVSDTWRPCSKLALLDAAQDRTTHVRVVRLDIAPDAPCPVLGEPQVRDLPPPRPFEPADQLDGSAIDQVRVPVPMHRDLPRVEAEPVPAIPQYEPADG